MRLLRFYQPASRTTVVEGVTELPLALAAVSGSVGRYRMELVVEDASGTTLHRDQWSREVPAGTARRAGATAVETFRISLAPGRYRVHLRVLPAEGEPVESVREVEAWGSAPALSDLLLATGTRSLAGDTMFTSGEVRRGAVALRTSPVPRLTLTQGSITYYAEIYGRRLADSAGQLQVEVLDTAGRRIVMTPSRALAISEGGSATRGGVDLTGLPEGEYRLRLHVRMGDSTVAADAAFRMTGLAALPGEEASEPADPFANLRDDVVDSLYAPLVYVLQEDERWVYGTRDAAARRRFLREFWRRRDPTPGTPDNSAMSAFYASVTYANTAFREGGAGQIPGWRTDRGRIYLKYGRPGDWLRRAEAPRPFEVWKYTRGRPLYFVFWDRSGLGHYELIHTNDRSETSQPGWERLLDPNAYEEVARFLNLRVIEN